MLPTDLRDRVLERLGFSEAPLVTVDGLNALVRAWGRTVPFDNLQKRIVLATDASAPLPCATPAEFFARYLAHGTGATCWPTSTALHALLGACGFDPIRLAGTMQPSGVHHGSVLVRMNRDEYLVDLWADEIALPLARTGTTAGVAAFALRAEPHGPLWRVWYRHPVREDDCYFEVKERDVDLPAVLADYEGSRVNSRFNTRIFARKNIPGGVVSVTRGARHVRTAAGLTHRDLTPEEQAKVLIEEFGYSPEIVARLPPDEPDP